MKVDKKIKFLDMGISFPVEIERETIRFCLKGIMENYHKSFVEDEYVEEKWFHYKCNFSFKVGLFEGNGKIFINHEEVRIVFYANEKFYWEKEIREDFEKSLRKYIDSSTRRIQYKIFKFKEK